MPGMPKRQDRWHLKGDTPAIPVSCNHTQHHIQPQNTGCSDYIHYWARRLEPKRVRYLSNIFLAAEVCAQYCSLQQFGHQIAQHSRHSSNRKYQRTQPTAPDCTDKTVSGRLNFSMHRKNPFTIPCFSRVTIMAESEAKRRKVASEVDAQSKVKSSSGCLPDFYPPKHS